MGFVLTGSNPVVTSSRITNLGSPIVERTILNRLLIPPLNSPTRPSRRCHNLTLFNLSSPTTSASSLVTPLIAAYNEIYISHHTTSGVEGLYMFQRCQLVEKNIMLRTPSH